MEIEVAVIARPASSTLGACLAALRGAEAMPAVVEIGSEGAGMARNRALAACDAQVLALVEDDVAVEAGWMSALRDAWEQAACDLAVVGGPLQARFLGGRPPWLAPSLDGVVTALDLGADAFDVDLAERTFHGGNVSFRADALRGAAGFWPARGHADGRDWFSEEHHAQQVLAKQGWRGRYEPRLAAARLVRAVELRPADIVRRRLRYGARLSAAGGGRRATAAGQALLSGIAGAVVASDAATRTERVARAAENLGALAGGRFVERDFEPIAARTPFRPSVPAPSRRRLRPRRSGAFVLLYHRVADTPSDPLGLCVAPDQFAEQLDVLVAMRRVVTLGELAMQREPGTVAITFDDGYRDNTTAAAPVLSARALPWTLFASTGHIEEGRHFWWDEVTRLLAAPAARPAPPELRLSLPGGPRAWRVETLEARERARAAILAVLQGLDADAIECALAAMRLWAARSHDDGESGPMTVDELRELATAGVAIGAHTRTHRGLAYAPPPDQRYEVNRSRDDLERWLGRVPSAFAFPFGSPGADVDVTSVAIVREAGFRYAFINAPGLVTSRSDPHVLPRSAVPNIGGDTFAAWLTRRRG